MHTLVDTKVMLDDIEATQADVDRVHSLLAVERFGGPVEMRRGALTMGGAAVDAGLLELILAVLPEVAAHEAESARCMRTAATTTDTADHARFLLTRVEDAHMVATGALALLKRLTGTEPARRRLFGLLPPTAKRHDPLPMTELAALCAALSRIAVNKSAVLSDAKSAFGSSAVR